MLNLHQIQARWEREGMAHLYRTGGCPVPEARALFRNEARSLYLASNYYQRLRQRRGLRTSPAQAKRLAHAMVDRGFGTTPYGQALLGRIRLR